MGNQPTQATEGNNATQPQTEQANEESASGNEENNKQSFQNCELQENDDSRYTERNTPCNPR